MRQGGLLSFPKDERRQVAEPIPVDKAGRTFVIGQEVYDPHSDMFGTVNQVGYSGYDIVIVYLEMPNGQRAFTGQNLIDLEPQTPEANATEPSDLS